MSDKFYCMYCGRNTSSISYLTSFSCDKNPEGKYCVPYEGREKDKYTCKYCGYNTSDISYLTSGTCDKSPSKYHIPSIH